MPTSYSPLLLFALAAVAIVVIGYLLYLTRMLAMWWTGVSEVVENQKETIRLLKIIAGEKPSDMTTSESKMPSHFR